MLASDLINDDDDFDTTAARKGLANGGKLPPGRYHARLIEAKDEPAGTTSLTKLTFAVVEGIHAKSDFVAKLWHSDRPANVQRQKLVMAALGMIHRNPAGKGWLVAEGMDSFADAIGAECVVEVEHVAWTSKTSDKGGSNPEATFNGFWHLTDPEVKGVKKAPAKPKAPRPEVEPDAI